MDILAAIADIKGFLVISLPLACIATNINIGQKMHRDLYQAITFTGLASSTFYIETKSAGLIPSRP